MNANDKFYARDAHVDAAAVTPLPNSRKVYVAGSRPDIRVPMREIAQSDTPAASARRRIRRSSSTTLRARTPIRRRDRHPRAACAARAVDRASAATPSARGPTRRTARARLADPSCRPALRPAAQPLRGEARRATSRRCTTRGAASSRRRWSSSRSARTCSAMDAAARPEIVTRQHPGESLRRGDPARSSRRSSCATRSRAAARSSRRTSTTPRASR